MKDRVAVIIGPTAVGKTSISIEIADAIDGEIISGDSMQVYKNMDIGTAKIREFEMISAAGRKIPHYLIDIIEPDEEFSVADFQVKARKLIRDINSKGKIPIIVGGTGLYINSVIYPYNFTEVETNWEFRNLKQKEVEEYGYEYVHNQLAKIDPITANRLHHKDIRRVIRALEIYHQTGKTLPEFEENKREDLPYDTVMIGLRMDREVLYQRINDRVDKMIDEGLIDEVRNLLNKGFHHNLNSMQGLGYRQIAAYLMGMLTKDEAVSILKRDTRRFAKRQFTWFNRDKNIKWFDVEEYNNISHITTEISEYIGRTMDNNVE